MMYYYFEYFLKLVKTLKQTTLKNIAGSESFNFFLNVIFRELMAFLLLLNFIKINFRFYTFYSILGKYNCHVINRLDANVPIWGHKF